MKQKCHGIKTREQIFDWLLSKARKEGDCLISHLRPNTKGYIPLAIGGRKGKKFRANRFVCEMVNGPSELQALHHCDRRNCINPDHIYWGSAQQNSSDMVTRGRQGNQHTRREADYV